VRGKAVRRNDVIDQSLNVRRPEAPLDAQLAGLGRMAPVRIGHSLEDRLGSVVALVKKEFSCGSYRQSRELKQDLVQNRR
jgi:hypothetical protein